MPDQLDDLGRQFIKNCEGYVDHVYDDGIGVKTAGYGHTGPDVKILAWGTPITQAQADTWFLGDISSFEQAVVKRVKVGIGQNQFNALVSFSYNVGAGGLGSSNLLSYINSVSDGNFNPSTILSLFLEWVYGGGVKLQGLVNRRQKEAEMFNGVLPPAPNPHPRDPHRVRIPGGQTHIIVPGDTLSGIAHTFHITLGELLDANPQFKANPNVIHPGETLKIPGEGQHGQPGRAGLSRNGVQHPDHHYTIQPGDNLTIIADKFGVSVEAIVALNHGIITNPNIIFAGQVINIPE